MSESRSPALQLEGVSKSFNGVKVLDAVDLTLQPGEVRGLIGENGSGKSTLIKIICGIHGPDPGAAMQVRGSATNLPVRDPSGLGISVVHQDLGIVDEMSVLENFGATSAFGTRRWRSIPRAAERRRLADISAKLEIELPASESAASLSPGQRAFLAVARAVRVLEDSGGGTLLILDEPTVFLGGEEAKSLIALVRSVATLGIAVIFVSHRLDEVLEVSDTVSVMRDGRLIETVSGAETTEEQLITSLLGRELAEEQPPPPVETSGPPLFSAVGVVGKSVKGVDFQVSGGEILGMTGLAGMGQDELPYLACGRGLVSGSMTIGGKDVDSLSPAIAAKEGVVVVPADRQRDALWGQATAAETVSLTTLSNYRKQFSLSLRRIELDAERLLKEFDVRPPDIHRQMETFSGGNQQKIVLARALLGKPRVLMLHEPTQGVDIGARHQIHTLVRRVADEGVGVIVFSTDYQELTALCTSVTVLRHGRVAGTVRGSEINRGRIARMAQGVA